MSYSVPINGYVSRWKSFFTDLPSTMDILPGKGAEIASNCGDKFNMFRQSSKLDSLKYLSNSKYQKSKATYTRPRPKKVKCPQCNENSDGYRGEHELRRHVERAHSTVRKVLICVDASENKQMLSNCKACQQRKVYGAYYNAAAQLRRVHFNPKEKGRKVRGKSDRAAGKGGGDWPPMEQLKRDWMIEVEELSSIPSIPLDDDDGTELTDAAYMVESQSHQPIAMPSNAYHLDILSPRSKADPSRSDTNRSSQFNLSDGGGFNNYLSHNAMVSDTIFDSMDIWLAD